MTCWMVMMYQFDPMIVICETGMHDWLHNTITLWGSINTSFTKEKAIKTLVYSCIILFDLF